MAGSGLPSSIRIPGTGCEDQRGLAEGCPDSHDSRPVKVSGLLLLMGVFQAPVPPARIEGLVRDALTSQPVARATVELRGGPVRGNTYVLSRDTGADGTFTFQNIPPGDYAIEVSHSGHINQLISAMQTLNPGQALTGVEIRLAPSGVIYGQLVNDRNEPVVGATVQAVRTRYRDGQRANFVAQSVASNDLGEYRLFNLPAGEYRVA